MFSERWHGDQLTLIIIGLIFLTIIIVAWPLLGAFIISLSLAVVVLPVHRWLGQHMSDRLSAALTTILVFITLIGLFIATISLISGNLDLLYNILERIVNWIRDLPIGDAPLPLTPAQIAERADTILNFIETSVSGFALSLPFLILQMFVFFLSFYLFTFHGDALWTEITRRLPRSTLRATDTLSTITVDALYAVYIVNLEVAVLTFFFAIPVFYLLGYGNIFFFSALSGLFQLIPFLGPQVLIVILAIYALILGDIRGAIIIVAVGYPMISGIADFYFRPKMMGKRVAISPILMMIGIFGGIALLGMIGIILGPLLVTLGVAAYHILLTEVEPRVEAPP